MHVDADEREARVGHAQPEHLLQDVQEDVLAAPRVLRVVEDVELARRQRRHQPHRVRVVRPKVVLARRTQRALPHGHVAAGHVARARAAERAARRRRRVEQALGPRRRRRVPRAVRDASVVPREQQRRARRREHSRQPLPALGEEDVLVDEDDAAAQQARANVLHVVLEARPLPRNLHQPQLARAVPLKPRQPREVPPHRIDLAEQHVDVGDRVVHHVAPQHLDQLELPRVRLRPRHAVRGGAVARALALFAAEPQRRAPRRAVHPDHVGDDRDVAAAARVRVLLERPHALDELGHELGTW